MFALPNEKNRTRTCRWSGNQHNAHSLNRNLHCTDSAQFGHWPKSKMDWDIFISYASEDRRTVAEPLAEALRSRGMRVWFDKFELKLGDRLRRSIEAGLAQSRYGIVILSPRFFSKRWPQLELDGLSQLEVDGRKVILPVWVDIDEEGVRTFSPMLAERVASRWCDGLQVVVKDIMAVAGSPPEERSSQAGLEPLDGSGWTAKTVRVGLKCGMLSQRHRQVTFSERFLENLVAESKKEFGRLSTEPALEVVRDMLIGASLYSKDRRVRIHKSDFLDFVNGINVPLTRFVYGITQAARIFEIRTGNVLMPDDDFLFHLVESLSGLESENDIEPKLSSTCHDVVLSRFLAYDAPNAPYSYLVATFAFFVLTASGYTSRIVEQVRSWIKGRSDKEAGGNRRKKGDRG